jgi:hypothetical protein
MTIIKLSDLQEEAAEGRSKFKIGDEVVFVNGAGIWNQLNGLTCSIKEISDDPIWTFRVKIDREDLIDDPDCFKNHPESDEFIVWCCAGNLVFENEIPANQKHHINCGQSKFSPSIDLDSLYPDDQIVYPELTLKDIPNLFDINDIRWLKSDEMTVVSRQKHIKKFYKEEYEQNPNSILYAMRWITYTISRARHLESRDSIKEFLNRVSYSDELARLFLIPVAVQWLDNGEWREAKNLLERIPENDRKKFGGFKTPWSIVLRMEKKIPEKQVKPWPKTIREN